RPGRPRGRDARQRGQRRALHTNGCARGDDQLLPLDPRRRQGPDRARCGRRSRVRGTHEPVPVRLGLCLLILLGALLPPVGVGAKTSRSLQRALDLKVEVNAKFSRGQYREAIPKAREALALREQALGPADPLVAESLQSLADLLRETADYTEARALYE